jgi:hypothetical protein
MSVWAAAAKSSHEPDELVERNRAADDGSSYHAVDATAPGDPKSRVEPVSETGGVFIYPRPNRLVLLRGGILHCVKKVERAAGEAFRASVSGFFFNTYDTESSGQAYERQHHGK